MSVSGKGRGRGWLNLNKNASIRPGAPLNTTNSGDDYTSTDELVEEVNKIKNSKYSNLITLLKQLDVNDDGILLNKKLNNIVLNWKKDCNSVAELHESAKYMYELCLQDTNLITKLIVMISSYSFTTEKIQDVKIRNAFIEIFQANFENRKHLQSAIPAYFRSSIKILGGFYNKARLPNGRARSFLTIPIVTYLNMLLESTQAVDLELFTTQLYLNGASIKSVCLQKFQDILMQVRTLLLDVHLTRTCRSWLLLALEIASNNFTLSIDIYKFYQEQLGDKVMINFQDTQKVLNIQTSQTNKSLDEYQSTVNVLQVSPLESTSPVDPPANNQNTLHVDSAQNINSSHKCYSQDVSWDVNDWDNLNDNREKAGRPILGAGARLHGNKNNNLNLKNQSKGNPTKWDNKQKIDSTKSLDGSKKALRNNSNKGWEHDDRFTNVYE